jgi:hypothetical protein
VYAQNDVRLGPSGIMYEQKIAEHQNAGGYSGHNWQDSITTERHSFKREPEIDMLLMIARCEFSSASLR